MSMTRSLLMAAGVALGVSVAGAASADPFQFTPSGVGEPQGTQDASRINTSATSRLLLDFATGPSAGVRSGTFTEYGVLNAESFRNLFNINIPSVTSGLGSTYSIYGIFSGAGTFSLSTGAAPANLSGVFTSFHMDLYIDTALDSGPGLGGSVDAYTLALQATGPYVDAPPVTGDLLLATLDLPFMGVASATADINISGIGGGSATGSFGGIFGVTLTPAGSSFFTSPVPFHQFGTNQQTPDAAFLVNPNPFPAGGFATEDKVDLVLITNGPSSFVVPEPGTLAMFGIGLLGLAAILRRRRDEQV